MTTNEETTQPEISSGGGLAGLDGPHPERFDPDQLPNTLVDSEHRGRYCWAAPLVTGRSVLDAGCGTGYGLAILAAAGAAEVTGVDLDAGAVRAAEGRLNGLGSVHRGDLQALDLPADSFDVAVCFEAIEHLDSPEQGMAELRRVVRPGGMVIVSSPNPDVYPSGNEHHRCELRPGELRALVEDRFPEVRTYLQHAWLASVIEPAEADPFAGGAQNGHQILRSVPPAANATTFAIVVGCDETPPRPGSLIGLGETFEVGWWKDRVSEAARSAEARLDAQKLEAERSRQEAAQRERQLSERLDEASAALVSANQELAQMPIVKHRLAELYAQKMNLETHLNGVVVSRSWRLTAFLRTMNAALRPQR
ncbi:MAG: methyltransferase domain-containing protein [Solirubrobacterales bacterium]|nr:methyltransferase domain-containing protein [Solirubrobacterales bacterium]